MSLFYQDNRFNYKMIWWYSATSFGNGAWLLKALCWNRYIKQIAYCNLPKGRYWHILQKLHINVRTAELLVTWLQVLLLNNNKLPHDFMFCLGFLFFTSCYNTLNTATLFSIPIKVPLIISYPNFLHAVIWSRKFNMHVQTVAATFPPKQTIKCEAMSKVSCRRSPQCIYWHLLDSCLLWYFYSLIRCAT